jgi:hypothetical protein
VNPGKKNGVEYERNLEEEVRSVYTRKVPELRGQLVGKATLNLLELKC